MELIELSNILAEMYRTAPDGEQSTMIHLFGIRYARIIRENEYSVKEIINIANFNNDTLISNNYYAEINKGIKLADYVIDKQEVINFIHAN